MNCQKINHNLAIKIYFLLLINISLICLILLNFLKRNSSLKVGVVGVRHEANIGNNLIKYAISVKLSELGYIPYIIGTVWDSYNNIEFIKQSTNLVILNNNFSEIKKDDYDILMVNSDQTWVNFDKNFYDYGFLKFAENWTIPKIVYGASLGFDKWLFSKQDEKIAKTLLKKFQGISVREKGSIELIIKHLGIKPELVLDPTFLIDKKYYFDLIEDFKVNITKNEKYIFVYNIGNSQYILNSMKNASQQLNIGIYYFPLNNDSSVLHFLYYIINSNSVITNSYHGTVFSIIFNKPFLTIYDKNIAKERYISLGNLFDINERMFEKTQQPNFNLLMQPLNINNNLLNRLRQESINFLKKSLNI